MKKRTIIWLGIIFITILSILIITATPNIFGHPPEQISGFSWNGNVGELSYTEISPQYGHSSANIDGIVWFGSSTKKGSILKPGAESMIEYHQNIIAVEGTEVARIKAIMTQKVTSSGTVEYALDITDDLDSTRHYHSGYQTNIDNIDVCTTTVTTSGKKIGIVFATKEAIDINYLKRGATLLVMICEFPTTTSTDWNQCYSSGLVENIVGKSIWQ